MIDRAGRLVHINARLCAMLRREADQLIGTSLQDLYSDPADRKPIDAMLLQFHKKREEEFFLPLPDGGRLPVMVSSRQVPGPAPLCDHRVITLIDISQQKEAERALQEHFEIVVQMSDNALQRALDLRDDNQALEQRVRERTAELHAANMDAIYMLAVAAEVKDMDTGAHVRRIQAYSRALALQLSLPDEQAEQIGYSAILHDVGKIHVPDHILNKPGPLTPDERRIMQEHTVAGEKILSPRGFFAEARRIARWHHENFDGSGYPDALAGDNIPLGARIVHVTDVYDALVSRRIYKEPWPSERAAEGLLRLKGKMFDPEIAAAFHALVSAGGLDVATHRSN
jgi:PAS domain S-box-containing protein